MFLRLVHYSNIDFTDDKFYLLIPVAMVVSYGHLTQIHPRHLQIDLATATRIKRRMLCPEQPENANAIFHNGSNRGN